ncbi:decapping mRNA 1B L homeolog [Xenopus laevis]|uniref:5'-(N(7)-methylguanosine 5'-triphospho)-[mRNA] hydrolase n=1 Tax=Xenopus laevis TaxID=8355 RepID=Q6DCZ8_XENLA|nr:decapping mRNA 1B L homeolog [Xenopus laevis]AAH77834.1 MGC80515 protein [Xenopus laevis]
MASCGSAAVDRGFEMSLAALRLNDPHIKAIVDVASQVALYTFSHNANEWEKTDVEGTLYVYTRSSSPQYGFTIMNSLSMENRTEPITKDLDFQIQDPFLLYRNARFFIYGIWFYDQEERQRIADLIKHLTRHERLNAQHGAACGGSPMTLDSGEGQGVDILHMLTKAMDEYNKQASSPQCIPASLSSGRLMSPLVFAQPSQQTRTNGSANLSTMEPSNLLFPTVLLENTVCTNTLNSRSIALTRSQLQEALLQHIQNDDNFLNTIYEAYLSSQRRGGTGRRQI